MKIRIVGIEGADADLIAIEVEIDPERLLRARPGALIPVQVVAIERRTVERA